MMQDERAEYGEEARDVIEGLRRQVRRVETPPDLLPTILARGEQLLPPQKERRAHWWTVVAVACLIAGVFVPWPRAGMPPKETVFEERSTPVPPALHRESTEGPPASPATPSQSPRQEMQQQTEPTPAPPEPCSALARR